MPVRISSGASSVPGVIVDGSIREQSLGVRVDAARSSGRVLEGRSGLAEVQRESWGRKDL